MFSLIIVGFFISILFLIVIAIYYNKFVSLRNKVKESWSGIDVQLKKRYDLIPNLVEIVKTYASHEKEVFENLARLRSEGMQAGSVRAQATAENGIAATISKIMAVAEAYPELKANENFAAFQASLDEIEDSIEMARRYYNALVRDNNTGVEKFPGVIIAQWFGFKAYDFFELETGQRENVKIKF